MPASVRVLGIDPGSRITGYGLVDCQANRVVHITSGCVRTANGTLGQRLRTIFDSVDELIERYGPVELSIEKVFMSRNPDSALKLGQARGAALTAAARHELALFEYSPNLIKQSVTGHGHADKQQVQYMVRLLLGLAARPQVDAADALAAAICHGHLRGANERLRA